MSATTESNVSCKSLTGLEIQPIDDSLEHIFSTMMDQGEMLEAVDFIRSIESQYIPTQHVMQMLIFQILMKSDEVKCLSKVSAYLTSVVNVYPPKDCVSRLFYSSSIVDSDGYLSNLWSVFDLIVNSYFIHHEIYVTEGNNAVKYPNCKILLEFYLYLFIIDLKHMNHENYKSCIIMNLLWPGGDACLSSRTETVLRWIDDTYGSPSSISQWAHLQKNMHELLALMVKCIIHGKYNLVEAAAFNDPILADISEQIANFCKNAYSNLLTLKMFLSLLTPKCLRAKVSEKLIRLITKQNSRSSILTLKEIVNQHMFPHRFNKWKSKTTTKEKILRKRSTDKVIDKSKLETTKLHYFCEENKFADLMVSLKTLYEHINTRDTSGCTPLFKACQRKHHMCVKILLNEAEKNSAHKLDATAANFEGLTPLHLAVQSNSLEIARMLLDYGGSDLLNVADNRDQRPADLDCSEEMEKLLKLYQPDIMDMDTRELNTFIEDSQVKEAPTLKSFKEYSIYLHSLNCLLCSYADLFQLYDLAWKKNTFVQNHSEQMCSHFVNKNYACSEDAALLSELPELLEAFIQSLCKNKSKLEINIDLELLPLKAFKSSIQCPQFT